MNQVLQRFCFYSLKRNNYIAVIRSSRFSTMATENNMDVDKPTEDLNNSDENIVSEGQATIYSPKSVFYNQVQEFNRDLTIAVISQFAKEHFNDLKNRKIKGLKNIPDIDNVPNPEDLKSGIYYQHGLKIFEGLAATGLRSARFALEIPGIHQVIANDFDQNAVNYIKKNIDKNKVEHLMKANYGDASLMMYQHRKFGDQFDVVDLDPYGSPVPFIDSAVQAVRDGGLLCVTATDMAVLTGGNHAETCFAKYGSLPIRMKACHEQALRILLYSLQVNASKYGRYIEPLICVSVDFYIRVFVRVYSGQAKAKLTASKMAMVYQCVGCETQTLQSLGVVEPYKGNMKFSFARGPPVNRKCEHCRHEHVVGGPVWAEPIHNFDFIHQLISYVKMDTSKFGTASRIMGVMTVISEELPDVPFYYLMDKLCSTLKLTSVPLITLRSAILNAGYSVSLAHSQQNSIKTRAPMTVIWDILRTWAKKHPVNERHIKEGTVIHAILSKEPSTEISFEHRPDANPESREQGLLRWQINPEKDWGPKARAQRANVEEDIAKKREKFQGKRKKADGDDDYYKQFPCKKFNNSECDLGEECKYSHEMTAVSRNEDK